MRANLDLIKGYLFYFILFVIIVLTSGQSIENINGTAAFIIGCVWIVLTILIYIFIIRKSGNVFAILAYALINALISGVTSSAYYSLKDVKPYKAELIIFIFAALLLINFCLSLLIRKRMVLPIINISMTIISLCASGYIWYVKDKSLGSSLFFMFLVYLCFAIAQFIVEKYHKNWINIISLSSLIMFGGILLVVLVVISEGDALEILEVVPEGISGKSKKVSR